ncbi:MAG: isoprenyl transferase, partial [Williamsia herbipolensis]|nr:isoprenyl transferase [Williamsia herbipolensis]
MKLIPTGVRGPLYRVYEGRLVQLMDPDRLPRHIAIIC